MKLTLSSIVLTAMAALLPRSIVNSLSICREPFRGTCMPPYVMAEETELERLYKDALEEGGLVNVYAGGDLPNGASTIVKAFESRFPGTKLNITVDLSKYHNRLIDKQLAQGGHALEADLAHLQTVQDFPRWKSQGVLMQYKPIGFEYIYDPYKDKEAYYWATHIYYFTNLVSTRIPLTQRPIEAADYLRPELNGGKIIFTYPNDDDAVLYQFMKVIEQNGEGWLKAFLDQRPIAVRGTGTPSFYINNGTCHVTFTSKGSLTPTATDKSVTILPKKTFFQSWAQLGGIFKDAKHPATAKLYISWLTSYNVQKTLMSHTWSQRTDIPPPPGIKPIWMIENTSPLGFQNYMENRTKVAEDMAFIEKHVGPVVGVSPLKLSYN
ncbi:hypothetical protein K7432_001333 [Basidiobolus ranarum]|uniref:Uncharacterized protein n=1 Tax=Basidiobolus ranarum TaxID=34480 RepID=A0ABR2X351_9FUNG